MKIFKIALLYLKSRPLTTSLNILIMAIGVALISSLLLFSHQVDQRINQDNAGIDLVVGAKGSPIQLVLSSLYHIDRPTGNISYDRAKKIMNHYDVKLATPISLGDNYRGFRIVGTDESFLDLYKANISKGTFWEDEMEAVIGYKVAKKLDLKIGDRFFGGHGLAMDAHKHEDEAYKIVGILDKNNSVIDRLVLTSLDSVWEIHEDHDEDEMHEHSEHHDDEDEKKEITAILITYKHITAILDFPRMVNRNSKMLAASPAVEINRLLETFGFGIKTVKSIGIFLVVAALLSIFISLLSNVKEKKYDIAVMRVLGAAKKKIFLLVIYESLIIGICGSLLGILVGHLMIALISLLSNGAAEIGLNGLNFIIREFYLFILIILLSALISIIPAFKAYKIDVAKILK